jgi:glycosyltransferase involved in cell wall biosynthesis
MRLAPQRVGGRMRTWCLTVGGGPDVAAWLDTAKRIRCPIRPSPAYPRRSVSIARITAYCLDWHLSFSGAFRDMLVDPLATDVDVELTAWDGSTLPRPAAGREPMLFCQLPPPPALLADPDAQLVWIPMWDHARDLDEAWWRTLPSTLRIVSFSGAVSRRARAAGLPTLELRYFKDPSTLDPVGWDDGVTAFYWNRTGLVGPSFLRDLCRHLGVTELLFLDRLDPGIGEGLHYDLPRTLGGARVSRVGTSDRAAYLGAIAHANVVVAPRASEGVGMTFLEAMCRGCCVMAYDAPTMSEYIQHGRNGLLFRERPPRRRTRAVRRLRLAAPTPHQIDGEQPWRALTTTALPELGRQAREDHVAGFARWQASRAEYARFITSW